MNIRNAFYSRADDSLIDCEIEHPVYGWIPTSIRVKGDDRPELVEQLPGLMVGPYVVPVLTADEQYKVDKAARLALLEALTVTTVAGNTFDADKDALNAMTSAIVLGAAGDSTPWKLANNTVKVITWEELKEAATLAGVAQTGIIAA